MRDEKTGRGKCSFPGFSHCFNQSETVSKNVAMYLRQHHSSRSKFKHELIIMARHSTWYLCFCCIWRNECASLNVCKQTHTHTLHRSQCTVRPSITGCDHFIPFQRPAAALRVALCCSESDDPLAAFLRQSPRYIESSALLPRGGVWGPRWAMNVSLESFSVHQHDITLALQTAVKHHHLSLLPSPRLCAMFLIPRIFQSSQTGEMGRGLI